MAKRQFFKVFVVALAGAGALAGCGDDGPPGRTFYERNIEPILLQSCASNVAGCHSTNDDDPFQFAAGNFDVTSFENVQKRTDLLRTFGPYQVPVLLIKAVGPNVLQFSYNGEFKPIEVQHAGGPNLNVGSDAYLTLLSWLENGATENGVRPPIPPQEGQGGCSDAVPPEFDPTPILAHANYDEFVEEVAPILSGCASPNCHGAPQADFYVTCGDTDEQKAFNFAQAWAFVNAPVDNSQLLQVPLAPSAGGLGHTGGEHFASRSDGDYVLVKTWAEKVGRIDFGGGDPAKEFFAANVQPILVSRGCSFEACHSPVAGNDFKLRSGSQGFFSAVALERNYDLMRNEFMAMEYPDARRGRAVAKGVLGSLGGIAHRGGAVFETPGAGGSDPANCPPIYDPATASAFCSLQEWVNIERAARIADGEMDLLDPGSTVPVVYVDRRETHVAGPLEFDTYQPGSDLMVAQATIGAGGSITGVAAGQSLLASCAGAADRNVVDVRSPDVRFDGTTVAFAMRTSAGEPLGVYTVGINGLNCTRVTPAAPDQGGVKIHNFDPAWAPDGSRIVFASTRGGADGPSMTRKLFQPQADIWRMDPDGQNPEQMTFLTNTEMSPQFVRKGRVIMSTEKVSEGFYQVAGRRINWDRTDYHPLLAQRAMSPFGNPDDPTAMLPSVNYGQATEIRERSDGNFVYVLSDPGAKGGAGTLATFNRSVGPFEAGRNDPGYLQSMHIFDTAATGRVGSPTAGAYRSPADLLDGRVMASYANFSGDLGTATTFDWDVVAVDPRTGQRQTLIGGPGAQVEAVLAVKKPSGKLYYNHRQLVFGGGIDTQVTGGLDRAVVHFPDAPMVFTLFVANLRRGRPVALLRPATEMVFYAEGKAPAGTTAGNTMSGIYEQRTEVGRAPLQADGSVKVRVPAGVGVIVELRDDNGSSLVKLQEEHQLAPGEVISLGIVEPLFDAVCGACHGSVSGSELDVAVTPDALTGASQSLSRERAPIDVP